ncbi:hypothetical protein EJB05_27481, partial [Eragrostis curvula]
MAPSSMSPKTKLPVVLLLLAAALAMAAPAAAQQPQEYCRDSLAGLMECQGFMHGAAAASPSCCAAYEAAFDADPFCLCYVADGTFARATDTVVDVPRALRIPISCGQAAPPVELCNMQGIVLPPYEPKGSAPAVAAVPEASAPAPVQPPSGFVTPPSFTTPPSPPSPTSAADRTFTIPAVMIIMIAAVVAAMA